jgi:putative peptide zinc metalloprotease protein
MIPVGGATKRHPALFVVAGANGRPAVAILSTSTPDPTDPGTSTSTPSAPDPTTTPTQPSSDSPAVQAAAFAFKLPSAPGPGGTQAVAVGTKDGGVTYDVAYSLVTVSGGAPVTNTNGAYAFANCKACTTVAVSFQVVLVVGESNNIAPINAAGALNVDCPACVTTALADQIVVTLTAQPSQALVDKLNAALQRLNALPELGAGGSPAAIAAAVADVQQQIQSALSDSGQLAHPIAPASPATTTTSTDTTATTGTSSSPPPTTTAATTTTNTTTTAPASTTPATTTTSAPSTTTTPTTTDTSTEPTTTTTTSSG